MGTSRKCHGSECCVLRHNFKCSTFEMLIVTLEAESPRSKDGQRFTDLRKTASKIVEQFQKNVPQRKIAKTFDIPTST